MIDLDPNSIDSVQPKCRESWTIIFYTTLVIFMVLTDEGGIKQIYGAQWFSGRVLDSRLRGRRFDPHWRLEQEH